ncbi:hypothetical protein ABID82_004757 [Methylobacterium sp. PvP062]|jgi:hypothetical protein|uniref:Uncharacterized protein n=1 Tax=Methylobacterium radiotolerans TaxID=31998 RepID=A0ABV2N8Q4_9HYPH|nr:MULTISPECIES: hypothetical protein [Methylobacterium]MCX7335217.1 hypothetical protein [Hyphomicrobiales bacterium]GAN50414.1 hypothetical protein ME121_4458 [Methylobacterium sp. ME121]MBN6820398.1 hypothetical protein [Methylobacterium organophilum]MBP2493919.1 hypothetical protein [Methylobacterium sp. PvP105]MBP2499707.1 hypothetical protein [Methylobacterium sp. PvP109]
MTDIPAPPPGSTEAATRAADQAATELGLGTDWAALGAPDWARVCRRAGAILAGQGQAPAPGWDGALARALGRPAPAADRDELARDAADTVLAEKGEVFAPEDDA